MPRSRLRPISGSNPRDPYQRPPAQRRGFFYARRPRAPRAPRPRARALGRRPGDRDRDTWDKSHPGLFRTRRKYRSGPWTAPHVSDATARSTRSAVTRAVQVPAPPQRERHFSPQVNGPRILERYFRSTARGPGLSGQTARPAALEPRRRRAAPAPGGRGQGPCFSQTITKILI